MAQTTGDNWSDPVPSAGNGTTQTLYFEHTVESDDFVTNGDGIKLRPLPDDARVVGYYFDAADIDSNGTPAVTLTLRVTDGTTHKNLFAASTIGQGGGTETPEGNNEDGMLFETTSNDFYLEVIAPAKAATHQDGVIKGMLQYTCRQPG